jgi:hypothetical protein
MQVTAHGGAQKGQQKQQGAGGGGGAGGSGTVDVLLGDIASRLYNIEGLYTNMSSKLGKVDGRVSAHERSVRELQHISAGAVHETARLAGYVGGSSPPPPGLRLTGGVGGAATPQHQFLPSSFRTPQPDGGSSLYGSGQVASTLQHQASQIHKLMAGLDFLEQHIIRQDAVVETVQKNTEILVSRLHVCVCMCVWGGGR